MELSPWLEQLHWRAPWWLLLALQPLLILILRRLLALRADRRFAMPHLLPWVRMDAPRRGSGLRTAAHAAAWLLLALAAAGPRLPQLEPGQTLRPGVDWMLAVDVSRSMTATDIRPSRLKRARIEVLQLLPQLRGDRVGLIAYAGEAHLIAPPTHDLEALARYLELLQPALLPTRGSRPEHALALAQRTLNHHARTARAVLLLTDDAGEPDLANGAASRLRADGIALYVMGIGTAAGSIEVADGQPGGRSAVDVAVQPRTLQALAAAGGGRYAGVTDDRSDWARLYDEGIATLAAPRADRPEHSQIQWRELYPWLLAPAALLFALTLLPVRWGGRSSLGHGMSGVAVLVLALAHAPPTPASDSGLQRQAFAAYSVQQYQTAADLYSRLSGYQARLGEGASAYRLGKYEQALREFRSAVLNAATPHERAAALLNLGNTYFQIGDYGNAAIVYGDALRYRADFEAAQRNRALAEKLAEAVGRELASHRPGPGRRRTEASGEHGAGPLTLGEATPPEEPAARPTDPDAEPGYAALIARGLRHAQVAAAGGVAGPADGTAREPSAGALAHMDRLDQDPAQLWRRMFEREEGFPAPLREPQTVPGVDPW